MFDEYKENARLYKSYTIQRTDPYGFWIILDEKAKRVKGIDSSFTNLNDAAKAIDNLVDNLKPEPKTRKKD